MAVQNGEKNNEFFAEGLANHLFEKIVGDRGSLIWERIVKHYHFLRKYRQSLFSSLNSTNMDSIRQAKEVWSYLWNKQFFKLKFITMAKTEIIYPKNVGT